MMIIQISLFFDEEPAMRWCAQSQSLFFSHSVPISSIKYECDYRSDDKYGNQNTRHYRTGYKKVYIFRFKMSKVISMLLLGLFVSS